MQAKQPSVAEVMVVDPFVIQVNASLEEVDIVFRGTYNSKVIPVVDSDGAFVGVISDADLAAYRFAHPQLPDEMTVRNEATNDAPRGHRSSR